jgi:hypothetical protein
MLPYKEKGKSPASAGLIDHFAAPNLTTTAQMLSLLRKPSQIQLPNNDKLFLSKMEPMEMRHFENRPTNPGFQNQMTFQK